MKRKCDSQEDHEPKAQRFQIDESLVSILYRLCALEIIAVSQVCKLWRNTVHDIIVTWCLNISEHNAIPRNEILGNSIFVFQLYELYKRKMISSDLYTKVRSKFYSWEATVANYDMFFVAKRNRIPLYLHQLPADETYGLDQYIHTTTLYGVDVYFHDDIHFWDGDFNAMTREGGSPLLSTIITRSKFRVTIRHVSNELAYDLIEYGTARHSTNLTDLFELRVPIPVIKRLESPLRPLSRRMFIRSIGDHPDSESWDYLESWIDFLEEPYDSHLWECDAFKCFALLFEKIILPIRILIKLMRLPRAPHYLLNCYRAEYALDKAQLEMLFLIPTIEERAVRRYWCNSDKIITEVMQNFLKSGVYICYD